MITLDEGDGASEASARQAAWQQATHAVLAKQGRPVEGDPRAVLDRRTVEGLTVPALADPSGVDRGVPGAFPFVRGESATVQELGWDIRAWLSYRDAASGARVAGEELAGGSTSLWVTLGGDGTSVDRLGDLLADVYVDLAPVVVEASAEVSGLAAAQALADVFEERGAPPHPRTNLGLDPFGRAVRHGGEVSFADVRAVADLAGRLKVRGLVVDGTAANDIGAGDAAELGLTLAAGVELLRTLESDGVDLRTALSLLEFRLAVTDDQFVSIAKLRAARLLWASLAKECGADADDAVMHQHAVTARPMLTRYDSWTNLLRTTIAAFAGGVGGAESVTVLPFDNAIGRPVNLSRRMARNISSLLISESHVAVSLDPAGGSHAVEALTDSLAEAGWAEFQRIEQSGGLRAALADGTFRSRVDATAETRARQTRSRKRPLTGVSEFPLADEKLPEREPWAQESGVAGWAAEFESLRDEPAAAPVLIATMGAVAQHTARATFATNLLTAGGVSTRSAEATQGPADVVRALAEAGTTVAVLAGSDSQYAADGAAYVKALREAGATWVLLAGKPSDEMAALVDDHLAVGQDVIEVVARTRSHLEPVGAES